MTLKYIKPPSFETSFDNTKLNLKLISNTKSLEIFTNQRKFVRTITLFFTFLEWPKK